MINEKEILKNELCEIKKAIDVREEKLNKEVLCKEALIDKLHKKMLLIKKTKEDEIRKEN